MEGIRDKCAVVGIGWTAYSRNSGRTELSLTVEAIKNAVEDAGLRLKDIDSVMTWSSTRDVQRTARPQDVAGALGLPRLRWFLDEIGGGTNCPAILGYAAMAIMHGFATNVVIYRARNSRSSIRPGGGDRPRSTAGIQQFLVPYGWLEYSTAHVAFFRRHSKEYGLTEEQMGWVSVASRRWASMNERAQMRTPITIEDYLKSPYIVEPFRRLAYCLETDGGCAVVITSADRARDLKRPPVYIMSAALGAGPNIAAPAADTDWLLRFDHTEANGRYIRDDLYRMAGVGPQDIDLAEIYDDFPIMVILALEDLGFCQKGEGGTFVENGRIGPGGVFPVNTHGGLHSEANLHNLNHVVEAVSQLRGDAGARQVRGAELALVANCLGINATAAILRR